MTYEHKAQSIKGKNHNHTNGHDNAENTLEIKALPESFDIRVDKLSSIGSKGFPC